jgi:diacylglycerol O-acyltransferase
MMLGVKRLNGMDAMLLYSETPNVHMHTLKVIVVAAADFEGEFNFEVFRRMVARRLHLLEPLRYKLVDIPLRLHHPMWLENCDIDLDYHLRRVHVPRPGGRRELNQVIGEVASTPLDRTRPLWEFHFADGMVNDRFAMIGKIHHALADGVASANLLARALDVAGSVPDERDLYATYSCAGYSAPTTGELLRAAGRDHLKQAAELPALVHDAAKGLSRVRRRARERADPPELASSTKPPPTFLNHVLSPARTFASATLSLAEVKETSKSLGITINDMVLAMSAGALRELLLRYDGRADEPIITTVPTSTDTSPKRITGNALGGLRIPLPVHIDEPLERIRLTRAAASIAKENDALLGPHLMGRAMAYLPSVAAPPVFRWLSQREAQNKMMNVSIANVPGPRQRGHISGAPVSEIYSVGPLSAGCGLNITVWSYVEQLNVSVLSDDHTLHDTHEVTDAMIHAFAEIRRAAGFAGELTDVDTAMAQASAG